MTAIGHGIGGVVAEFGKLLTVFSGKDVAHGINIAFDAVKLAIRGVVARDPGPENGVGLDQPEFDVQEDRRGVQDGMG